MISDKDKKANKHHTRIAVRSDVREIIKRIDFRKLWHAFSNIFSTFFFLQTVLLEIKKKHSFEIYSLVALTKNRFCERKPPR